ncbi:MAG: hypothetical protein AAFR51_08910 [Pseudomonadota bacterium]
MDAITDYQAFCRAYDAGKAVIGNESKIYMARTSKAMNWKWRWDQSAFMAILGLILGKSRKQWFLSRCRFDEEGFRLAYQNSVEFFERA